MTLLTPEAETLTNIAHAIDGLPLSPEQRAEVFHAWETAPVEPLPFGELGSFDRYCDSPAGRAWHRVREFTLHREGGSFYATTLNEAAHYESAPTQGEILAALIHAEHTLAG